MLSIPSLTYNEYFCDSQMQQKIIKYISIGLFLLLVYTTGKNITANSLSYDESVQFWISKGISPDAELGTKEGGIKEVIWNNRNYNLDPGGFSVLLHFWLKISNEQIWMRLLPFLFWFGIIWGVYSILFSLSKNLNFSILGAILLMLYPVFVNTGFEIRAFSMAGFGSVMGVKALLSINNKKSLSYVGLWGLLLGVLMTSRYAIIPLLLVISLFIMFEIFRSSANIKSKAVSIIAFGIPLLISFMAIYFLSMFDQNKYAEPLHYIPYLSKDATLLFSYPSILILFSLLLITVLILLSSRLLIQKEIVLIWKFTLIYFLFVIALSFLGIHPWQPFHLRGVSLLLTLFLSLILIFYILVSKITFVRIELLTLCFTLFLAFANRYKLQDKLGSKNNAVKDIIELSLTNNEKVLVDMKESPHLKYHLTYGELVLKRDELIKHLHFTLYKKHQFHGNHETLETFYKNFYTQEKLSEFDFIISPVFEWMESAENWEKVPNCQITWRKKS